jgi:hypothetical protein
VVDRLNEPGKLENCSGTRTLMHNIADLKAQIAANLKVILLYKNFYPIILLLYNIRVLNWFKN